MANTKESVEVAVYGTDWCRLTRGFCSWLESLGVPFAYHNIDHDTAAETAIIDMNGGKRKFPMVVVGNLSMKNPPVSELQEALSRHGFLEER